MFKSIKRYVVNKWQTSGTFRKAVFTALLICIYKILSYIPLAFIDRRLVSQLIENGMSKASLLLNSGVEKFSIISLGIMPYISASILMQLLSSNIGTDEFRALKHDNENGMTKIEMYTKYLTIIIAFLHGIYTLWEIYNYKLLNGLNLVNANVWLFFVVNTFNIVTGSLICLWLSNLISKKGIGNGVNTIIFVNLVNETIKNNVDIFKAFSGGFLSLNYLILIVVFIVFIFIFAIITDNSAYKIRIHPLGTEQNEQMQYMKIKLNMSGITNVILTNYLANVPVLLETALKKIGYLTSGVQKILSYIAPNTFGNLVFLTILIIFTSLNYSNISLDIKDIANQLQENNVMVTPRDQEIRPGTQTYQYISRMINNWINAFVLIIIYIGSQVFIMGLESRVGHPVIKISGLSILLAVSTAKNLFLNIVSYNYNNLGKNYYQEDKEEVNEQIRTLQQKIHEIN